MKGGGGGGGGGGVVEILKRQLSKKIPLEPGEISELLLSIE